MTVAMTTALLAASLIQPYIGFAEQAADPSPFVVDGQIVEGRTLIPVRHVATGLGADVNWNQASQTVTIHHQGTTVQFKINSNKVQVGSNEITIDVPARVERGVTYVPVRFVSQALGGNLGWNSENKTTTISLNNKQVIVTTEASFNYSQIPQQRVNTIIQQANIATNVSGISQIRAHFKPYFTDKLINQIIRDGGFSYRHQFMNQAYTHANQNTGTITQISTEASSTVYAVERMLKLVKVQGQWLVDDIHFVNLYP
ncbi:copper amine oxidase N-terminal domain-containing protein [Paenibacillus sp. JCM 10914]